MDCDPKRFTTGFDRDMLDSQRNHFVSSILQYRPTVTVVRQKQTNMLRFKDITSYACQRGVFSRSTSLAGP